MTTEHELLEITKTIITLIDEENYSELFELIKSNSQDSKIVADNYFNLFETLERNEFPTIKQNGLESFNPFLNYATEKRNNRGNTWNKLTSSMFYFLKARTDKVSIAETIEEKTESVLSSIRSLSIDPKAKAFVWLRQSIARKEFQNRHTVMGNTLLKFAENLGYKDIHTEFQADLSGFDSHELILEILSLPEMESMFAGQIDRIARNLEGYMMITQYAYDNHKRIYLNSTLISEGTGYISGLVQAIFGEFDLLSKQTSFSHYMHEVALFLTGKIKKSEMVNPKAIKLITLARFVDRVAFLEKLQDKAIGIMDKYDKKEKNKNGSLKVSKELNEVAIKVLETIYEE